VAPAVRHAGKLLETVVAAARQDTRDRVQAWADRVNKWDDEADRLIQRSDIRERRSVVAGEREIAESLLPNQRLVRPLLVVTPAEATS
jgi:hypothetical protein